MTNKEATLSGLPNFLAFKAEYYLRPGRAESRCVTRRIEILNMLRLGCSTGAFFPESTTVESLSRIARLGITDVEVMLQAHREYQRHEFQLIGEIASEHGLVIRSVHALQRYHPVFDSYRSRADEGWEMFELAADGASLLGASTLVWHGSCRSEQVSSSTDPPHLDAINRLAGICASQGLVLGLENVSWCAMAQVRDVLALSSEIPAMEHGESIRFTFDVFQAAEAGANPFMILAAMKGRIANVHLRDFRNQEPEQRNLMPGDGDLPWPALIRAIANSAYAGPLMLEGHAGDDAEATFEAVRTLVEPLIASSLTVSDGCEGDLPSGVVAGIALFNAGEFYQCHEVIEHEWHAERGQIRQLYQGILQIGVGFHHARSGNQRGAVLLLHDGIAKVSRFLPRCRGVDTERLVIESSMNLDAIRELDPDGARTFAYAANPRISYVNGSEPTS